MRHTFTSNLVTGRRRREESCGPSGGNLSGSCGGLLDNTINHNHENLNGKRETRGVRILKVIAERLLRSNLTSLSLFKNGVPSHDPHPYLVASLLTPRSLHSH
ncbi:hypothetical protein BD410DRAFT_87379 [Rickenella mellea]|uniref:Uncharacterized protein n=1 Tax=Rickenella mellea TaxID=50990 RepID=A0A4Y7PMC2_9AGAM|nr:hypothetical protein BD410DRAFT_87379 [Rickenella mellea]